MFCKLTSLDKNKATFKGDTRTVTKEYAYSEKQIEVPDATVHVTRQVWEEAGSPSTLDVVFVRD